MADYWNDNGLEPGKHTLIDLGYVDDKSMDKVEKLLPFIKKRNFQVVGFNRLVVRIPPEKVSQIINQFPIKTSKERKGYIWCTHTWIDEVG